MEDVWEESIRARFLLEASRAPRFVTAQSMPRAIQLVRAKLGMYELRTRFTLATRKFQLEKWKNKGCRRVGRY